MTRTFVSLGCVPALLLVLGAPVVLAGCDPNAKVVRAGQQEPKAPEGAGSPADGQKNNNDGRASDSSGQEVLDGLTASPSPPSDSGGGGGAGDAAPNRRSSEGDEGLPTDSNSRSIAVPKGGSSPDDPGVPEMIEAPKRTPFPVTRQVSGGQSGAKPSGRCATGDWGACFREARPFVASDPQKAINLYLSACLPGQPKGDGLACQAAGFLAEAMGNTAMAASYFQSACAKVDFPVMAACNGARKN